VQEEEGWRTPENMWMEMEEAGGEIFFVNALQVVELNLDEELEAEIARMEAAMDDCLQRRAKRAGIPAGEPGKKHMSEKERDLICEELGVEPGAGAKRKREIEEMDEEEVQTKIRSMEAAMRERVKPPSRRSQGLSMGKLPLALKVLCLVWGQADAFTAYDFSNRSNITESYLLLEPEACTVSDKTREFKTTVYGEIAQIKQDRIIPIFRCQVIETIVSQYCGHWSSAGVTKYIWFREPKALEAWECRQVRSQRKVVIGGRSIQATIGATVSHAVFLSGAMDDDRRNHQLPQWKNPEWASSSRVVQNYVAGRVCLNE
jgi:hypothetical protein